MNYFKNQLLVFVLAIVALSCQKDELEPAQKNQPETGPSTLTLKSASISEFSILTYNVAGLLEPFSSGNPSKNTPYISELTNNFDMVHVQEDFNYHAALYADNHHPYRTSTSGGMGIGDGLNTMSNYPFSDFKRVDWNACNGADCLTPKGFTFMRVRMAEGIYIDFYNAHPNAGSSGADLSARRSNIAQLSQFITNHSKGNPVIVMGDMNCRYTRTGDNIRELITQNGLADAWVQVERGGNYPALGSEALVCNWPNFNDVTCEVVDKIFYRSSKIIALTPTSYQLDHDDFVTPDGSAPLSDHYPVIANFRYSVSPDFKMSDLFGGPHGTPFNDLDNLSAGSSPIGFTLRAGKRVDNVGVRLAGGALTHGGSGGTAYNLNLNAGEYVNYVKMCAGKHNGQTRIFYVQLKTNHGRTLTGGRQTSNVKEFFIPSGWKLAGFYGNAGTEIDKLGLVYTRL
jgi:endonuclease/exonuclease/phosphatase (EEP) superfamily protein YafD